MRPISEEEREDARVETMERRQRRAWDRQALRHHGDPEWGVPETPCGYCGSFDCDAQVTHHEADCLVWQRDHADDEC